MVAGLLLAGSVGAQDDPRGPGEPAARASREVESLTSVFELVREQRELIEGQERSIRRRPTWSRPGSSRGRSASRGRTPPSMRVFVEADYAGPDNSFRLRHAFGQWRKFIIGQTWSTFADQPVAVGDPRPVLRFPGDHEGGAKIMLLSHNVFVT